MQTEFLFRNVCVTALSEHFEAIAFGAMDLLPTHLPIFSISSVS